MGNFRGSFDFPLINSEIELDFTWSKKCIISEISRTAAVAGNPDANPPVPTVEATLTTGAVFQINNPKHYVPVVTLPMNDNIKFLEHLKKGLRRTVSLNKYRSQINMQPKKQQIRLYN